LIYDSNETVPSPPTPPELELSIGTLSQATGVPVDTLRTWERRYGFPRPLARTEGSHRRYSVQTITTVQLIVQALDQGHRAAAVVGRHPDQLRRLIEAGARNLEPQQRDAQLIDDWLRLTREREADALTGEFQRCLAEMPALEFLERCMGPYLFELGARWQRGELEIYEEHLASERVRDFLSAQWRPLTHRARRPAANVILATPQGERHVLGLHMAAWVVACAGAYVIFLGADTPANELVSSVRHFAAQGVVLSVAAGYRGNLPQQVLELTSRLPPRVSVVVGGAGSHNLELAARTLNGFNDLQTWAELLTGRVGTNKA